MDIIITFFRDILDGPLYIGVVIVNSILICSCIGYMGEQYLNKQKAKQEFEATHAQVENQVQGFEGTAAATTVNSNIQTPVDTQSTMSNKV